MRGSSTKVGSNIIFPTSPTVTTTVTGLEFSGDTTFSLVGNATIPATKVVFKDSTTAYVTFNLQGQPLGNYALRADDGAASGTLPNAMQIVSASGGTLDYDISSPTYIRAPFLGVKVTITYKNTGLTDLPAPYFTLIPDNAEVLLDGQTGFATGPIGILGVAQDGLAGIIAPGASYKIDIPYRAINATQGGKVGFTLQVLGNNAPPLDWDFLEEETRPQGTPVAGWQAAFANFKTSVGTDAKQFHRVLVDNANYLSQFGKVTYNVLPLLGFELQQADNFGEISGRFVQGKFGFGGLGPFATKASADDVGNVTFSTGKTARAFVKTGANYVGLGISETGSVTVTGGAFLLTEASGSKTQFRADGQIDFIEDSNGERLTGAYNAGGQLTSIANSTNGDVTSFGYVTTTAGSFIGTVTDAVNRVTTYTYTATGDVLSVTTPQGATSFTYGATPHAPATITGPDGVVTSFTYNAAGLLSSQTLGTGPDAITTTFTHDSAGKITFTDNTGETVQVFRNLYGRVGRVIDSLGNISSAGFDASGRPVGITDASGATSATNYSRNDLPSEIKLGNGSKISVAFNAKNLLTSLVSPGGDATGFGYDAAGNTTSIIQPDGSSTHFTYDTAGRVLTESTSGAITTTYSYNSAGLVSQKSFSTGGIVNYTYDTHRNLLTATDGEGATTFTYNAQDLMTSVSYPNGKSIAFTYDSANRRATITEGGYTVKYSYDALGRIDTLRDAADALIIDYGYDELGRVESETRGNSATTIYDYDDASRVTNIVHRNASNAVIEQFSYVYDANNRVSSATSTAGTTTYAYDTTGQLVSALLPGGRSLTYTYDADGNRTSVSDNGTPVNYSANAADQYLSIGSKNLSYDSTGRLSFITDGTSIQGLNYDARGQLISSTEGANTTSYDYDALGNRIGVIINGERTDFAIDPAGLGNVFTETSGGETKHYANGLGIVGAFATGETSYFHYDRIGNTAALTGATSAVQNTYAYLPFGEIAAQTGSVENRFTFNGAAGVQDDNGDTYYMRNRYYDADMGRFTKRDPIGLLGGDTTVYRFASNDPSNRTDPNGLDDFYAAVGGEFTTGGGGNLQGGAFITTSSDGFINNVLDSGVFIQGGSSVGVNIGATAGFGYTPDLSGFSNNINGSFKVVGGSVQLDDNGKPIGGFAGFAPSLDDIIPAPTGSASASINYGQKLTVRDVLSPVIDAGVGVGLFNGERNLIPDSTFNEFAQKNLQDPVVKALFDENTNPDPRDRLLEAIREANKLRQEHPDDVPPKPKDETESINIGPRDPNQIIGPAGFGAEEITGDIFTQPVRFGGWVKGGDSYGFTVLFENKPEATAPAQIVTVTQTLDSDLDLSTFTLGSLGWAEFEATAPAGLSSWQTRVDATATLGVFVDIDASLNAITRELRVVYTSIDPATGDVPTDPFTGFLHPNITAPEGDGFFTYSVRPLATVLTGTEITAVASVVFDYEAPLATPTLTNKIDTAAAASAITPFANATSTRGKFAVNLTGADEIGGSGLFGTTVFYSDNGGALVSLVTSEPGTKFLFSGGIAGHTYTFYSAAQDNAGNLEALALTPDATIQVIAPTLLPVGKSRTFTDSDGDTYTVKLSGPGTLSAALLDPDNDGKGALDQLTLTNSTAKSKVTITVKKAKTTGNGIVNIGDITVTGDLGAFTAKASDFTVEGIVASGAVGKITVRDFAAADAFVAVPGITAGGTALSKLKLAVTARNIGDGFVISTGTAIAAITAAAIGDGDIAGATLGKLTTKVGSMDANLGIAGAVGTVSIKGSVNVSQWTIASIGAVTIGGSLAGDIDATTTIKSVTLKNGALTGQLTGTTIGAVKITGGGFGGFIGSSAAAGKVKGLTSLSIAGGDLTGSINIAGNAGAISVKESKLGVGGAISGDITAHSLGKIAVTGGDLRAHPETQYPGELRRVLRSLKKQRATVGV